MKQCSFLIMMVLTALFCHAQVPQFTAEDFQGWEYNNPNVPITQNNILSNRITLYVTADGRVLTLTSPPFTCHRGETIELEVKWVTTQWQDDGFNVNWVALTAALLDETGATADSVTCIPDPISRTNYLKMQLVVPRSMRQARLRFAAWKSIVSNCGAVAQIVSSSANRADVNRDGEVNVSDINAIIAVILSQSPDAEMASRADVNGDGEVNVSDINRVIDVILG